MHRHTPPQQRRSGTPRLAARHRDEDGQTTAFVVKLVVTVPVVGFIALDLGGPILTRIQIDNDARNATSEVTKLYSTTGGDVDAVQARLEQQLDGTGIAVAKIEVTPPETKGGDSVLHITYQKDVKSWLFGRLPPLKGWYHVEVTTDSEVKVMPRPSKKALP